MRARIVLVATVALLASMSALGQEYIGQLSKNPYDPDSTSNPYGAGSPYKPDSINNPYGRYGSPYSNQSANNPYATDAPKLYDSEGNYKGKLSSNPYDPESISNPYGRYGSRYSSDSLKNPYGAGNPYSSDSPTNPYGEGWKIIGQDEASSGFDSYDGESRTWRTLPNFNGDSGHSQRVNPTTPDRGSSYSFEPAPLRSMPSFESSYDSNDAYKSDRLLKMPELNFGD